MAEDVLTIILSSSAQWVTSISGPEGITAAQATGSLLLAAGRAGSLRNCLVDETEDTVLFMANLFLPTPTMALMIGAEATPIPGRTRIY
jgi:hypothetical protein